MMADGCPIVHCHLLGSLLEHLKEPLFSSQLVCGDGGGSVRWESGKMSTKLKT